MKIHIGKKIKGVFYNSPLSATEFARRINKSRTIVYNIFSRSTIDTGLLLRIGKVLDYDFFADYSESKAPKSKEDKHTVKITKLEKEIRLIKLNLQLRKNPSKS